MKKLLTALCILALTTSSAQTLFTYGKERVSADEFTRAFKKNNNAANDEKALKEYLDLYIASRLKIKEARAIGFDTLSQLRNDLLSLRQQILPGYLNDRKNLEVLVKEAFTRSQKDIRIQHIFIAFEKAGSYNGQAADQRKREALEQLTRNVAFEEVAKRYSDDPSAIANGGNIGWITAFTLPYELENVVYSTSPGKVSSVYTSKAGHHIFKNSGERKALGRMKAAQILLAFPPGADEAYKAKLKKKADSLYNRLQAGDDFGKLASAFSNDVISAVSGGQMSEFGVGEFSPAFEAAAFGLPKDGALTKPFQTEHGYHIVKRIKLLPVAAKLDAEAADDLQRKVESSDRVLVARKALAEYVLKTAGHQKLFSADAELWALSDSLLNNTKPAFAVKLTSSSPVIKIGNLAYDVSNWISFAQANRYKVSGSIKPYQQLWDEFVQATALQYYQEYLEDFNEDFRRQITEFGEGNLFFEIMQQKVWTPAQTDTIALLNFYQKHKSNYVWKESANAVIFYAVNADAAKTFQQALSKTPADWRSAVSKYSEQITADSGRFELGQIPKGAQSKLSSGMITAQEVNPADNTVSFAYVIHVYKQEEPRSFADAKGLVINDYQAELEKAWITELKKKYPVTVNENVWRELVKTFK